MADIKAKTPSIIHDSFANLMNLQTDQGKLLKAHLLLEEFKSLRDEILKRTEIEHNLVHLTLIAAGAFIAFGLQAHRTQVFFAYPLLAMFLATEWAFNNMRITQIGGYLHDIVESACRDCAGWEHHWRTQKAPLGLSGVAAAGGIFPGCQVVVLLVGEYWAIGQFNHWALASLLLGNVVVIALTLYLILQSQQLRKKEESKRGSIQEKSAETV